VITERRRVSTLVALTTFGLIVALGVQPVSAERIVAAYVLALAAIALASLTRILDSESTHEHPSHFDHALARMPERPGRPSELVRTEREITLGSSSAGHLHTRLLPLLREVAEARLGFELERRRETARARLGEETWELLRPDRPAPEDRSGPGLPLRRVRAVVESLERL
jgi:hypothetical protein